MELMGHTAHNEKPAAASNPCGHVNHGGCRAFVACPMAPRASRCRSAGINPFPRSSSLTLVRPIRSPTNTATVAVRECLDNGRPPYAVQDGSHQGCQAHLSRLGSTGFSEPNQGTRRMRAM